jgi:hypothetical protein
LRGISTTLELPARFMAASRFSAAAVDEYDCIDFFTRSVGAIRTAPREQAEAGVKKS